jgi:hypothetical protein
VEYTPAGLTVSRGVASSPQDIVYLGGAPLPVTKSLDWWSSISYSLNWHMRTACVETGRWCIAGEEGGRMGYE